jgi:hypothetical protein
VSAVNDSLNNLTVSLYLLRTAADEYDRSMRLPFQLPEPLKSIAEELRADTEMVDIEAVIHIMDRISAQCRVRARHINKLTKAIKNATSYKGDDHAAQTNA